MSKIKTLLIGYGYWGPNLARNLTENSDFDLFGVLEVDQELHEKINNDYPDIKVFSNLNEVDSPYDAAVIATPATSHYEIAKQLIEQGVHLLIEKPLATSVADSEEIIEMARNKNLKLMVGHTYLYHPAIKKIKQIINSGEIGDLLTIHSERLNLGQIRQDINVMWNLAPHDFSILCYLTENYPITVNALGNDFIKKNMHDIIYVHMEFPNNITGFVHNSWLHPLKSRKVIVVGSKGMIVFDDTIMDNQVVVYEKGVDWDKITKGEKGKNSRFEIIDGNHYSPDIEKAEPLAEEIKAFSNWILNDKVPITDSVNGLEIVKILEKAQESIS
ncbi:MAG: oxidoreductase [Actinobacteria bacterium]|nr:oxidoreductase [Actinomycetota bacterium]|tara:strand:+ start:1639 stop:2628 length:990 start_codon:yes stop_codon:yes gene_type:complete